MFLFLETILTCSGEIPLLPYHILRMEKCLLFHYHKLPVWFVNIENELMHYCIAKEVKYKLNILYDMKGYKIKYSEYEQKKYSAIQLAKNDAITYNWKYSNRLLLEKIEKEVQAQSIAIIVKNGLITDTPISNIALWNGKEWHTPLHPLLYGTRRQFLINNHFLIEKEITESDFKSYEKISIINAMNDINEWILPI